MIGRREFLAGTALALAAPSIARAATDPAADLAGYWFGRSLLLIRHTATFSPPVAARALAYLGTGLWETVAASRGLTSLAGQMAGFDAAADGPGRIDLAAAVHGAMAEGVRFFFANTGPAGQNAMRAAEARSLAGLTAADAASIAAGAAIMRGVIDWSLGDGGATIVNLGFPEAARPPTGPADWVPTSTARLQQAPLLPAWGNNRPMALAQTEAFLPPPPLDYSEDRASPFCAEAEEVFDVSRALTDEQKLIARFWSDDPMLSFTPPGHWTSILLAIAGRDAMPVEVLADALARVGICQNDAFIACWRAKFRHNLLRPVTYIRRVIDPAWAPLLITPPFPEYTSGHSCQSGAASEVLSALLGEDLAFDDATHEREKLPVRRFPNFRAAADEAALSRLYGGIHFRRANEQGLAQGRRIGGAALVLRTL